MSEAKELALSLLFFVPAFVANSAPLLSKRIIRTRHPVDLGRLFIDGKRVFGDNKTWEGFAAGLIVGTLTGAALKPFYPTAGLAEMVIVGLVEGLGAMIGDLANSFVKRRLGMKPGMPLPILDQTSFIIVAVIMVRTLQVDKLAWIELKLSGMLLAVLVALVLHPLTNYIAYKLGLKEVPY